MALITTILGEMDEALLEKREAVIDNEHEHTVVVEYCLLGCDGPSHITGQPEAVERFCSKHVHRSAHVVLKKGLDIGAVMQGFQ